MIDRHRILHSLFGHKWRRTGFYAVAAVDAFHIAVERQVCDCGSQRWDMTREATRWAVRNTML